MIRGGNILKTNNTEKQTVFFAPFVGEFGWELLYWHAYITNYKNCNPEKYIIACCYKGREQFYSSVDEIWNIPQWFSEQNYSAKSYITDHWQANDEIITKPKRSLFDIFFNRQEIVETSYSGPEVKSQYEKMMNEFTGRLPLNTIIINPTIMNAIGNNNIGTDRVIVNDVQRYIYNPPAFDQQYFQSINPTNESVGYIKSRMSSDQLITILPRRRMTRRSDKNWERERYVKLIELIKRKLPSYNIAIAGDLTGAYFAGDTVEGVIDLINIDNQRRLDLHLAAFQLSSIVIGGMSGAILVALTAGAPAFTWGFSDSRYLYYYENKMMIDSELIYYPNIDIDENIVFSILHDYLENQLNLSRPWEDFHIEDIYKDSMLQRLHRFLDNKIHSRNKHWTER